VTQVARPAGWLGLRPTRAEALAALGGAVLFALAFPPLQLVVPVFVCLVPLAVFVARCERPGQAGRVGFWFAILAFGSTLYWIAVALLLFTKLALLAYAATVLCLGAIYAGALVILWHARRMTRWPMAVLVPPIWVASEMLLMHLGDIAFPWLPLALGVSHSPHLSQLADISGEHGLSLFIAMVNGLVADAVIDRKERVRSAALAVAMGIVLYAYGAWRLDKVTPLIRPLAPMLAVQPNIPEDEKMQEAMRTKAIGILMNETRAGLHADTPALVVWPETALPDFLVNHTNWPDSIRALTRESHAPLLFGVIDVQWYPNGTYDFYNAALLADSTGRITNQAPYRKEFLVPIVERVPFVNPRWFAGLKYFGGFGRGHDPVPFQLPFGRVGVVICYESIFGDLFREYRQKGTDAILNITNDAWFGETNAPWQHVAHLRLRAIENRIGIVQVANTGISEYVDPVGRVHDATKLTVAAATVFNVGTTSVRTLYDLWGDWIGYLAVIVTAAFVVASSLRRKA
jgi:apolipoprotein N-acyltransferase